MQRPSPLWLLGLAVGPLCGCTPPHPAQQLEPGTLAGITWVAHLSPTVAVGTRILGDVRITPSTKANYSHIVIELSGGAISNRHPWAVSSGSCTEAATIELGGRAMYPSVELRTDGIGKLSVDLPFLVPVTPRYHVSVFASATERDLIVSCGELRPVA